MKVAERPFMVVLSVLLVVFCFAVEHISQTRRAERRTRTRSTASDLSSWQAVLLNEKGIRFKLPLDWHRAEMDWWAKQVDYFEMLEWSTSAEEMIRISISTLEKGFSSGRYPVSKAERLDEELNSALSMARNDSSYSEVQKLSLGRVGGVFRILETDFKNELGIRRGPIWTGYRVYKGKNQKIELNFSGHPTIDGLLRTIIDTFEFEEDTQAS